MALSPPFARLGDTSVLMCFSELEYQTFSASLLEATECATLPKIFEKDTTGMA